MLQIAFRWTFRLQDQDEGYRKELRMHKRLSELKVDTVCVLLTVLMSGRRVELQMLAVRVAFKCETKGS